MESKLRNIFSISELKAILGAVVSVNRIDHSTIYTTGGDGDFKYGKIARAAKKGNYLGKRFV